MLENIRRFAFVDCSIAKWSRNKRHIVQEQNREYASLFFTMSCSILAKR